jgi:hypothetical protein
MSRQVVEQIWRWKETSIPTVKKSPLRPARRAAIQAVIVAGIGGFFHARDHKGMAFFLFSVAGFLLISGLFFSPLFLEFERLGKKFGQWFGAALTWMLLVPMFFIVFFPGRLILWLIRKDPMNRGFPSKEETYWIPRPPVEKIGQYTKQY